MRWLLSAGGGVAGQFAGCDRAKAGAEPGQAVHQSQTDAACPAGRLPALAHARDQL